MHQALRATSESIRAFLQARLRAETQLSTFFDSAAGGTMDVLLNTPEEMQSNSFEGVSLWLYRLKRDEFRHNDPPRHIAPDRIESPRFPARLHYLVTPIVTPTDPRGGPNFEQLILGVVLQAFNEHPTLSGPDLASDFEGTDTHLSVHFDPMGLEETTRVWDALEESYQLCLSYEVSLIHIDSQRPAERVSPVLTAETEYGTAHVEEAAA